MHESVTTPIEPRSSSKCHATRFHITSLCWEPRTELQGKKEIHPSTPRGDKQKKEKTVQCWSHHFITLPIRTPRRSKKHMSHSRLPPASHTCCCRRVLSGNPNGTREEAHSFRHIDIHLKHIQHAQGPNSRARSTCKKIRTFSVEEEEKREFTREEEEGERERG